MNGLHRGCARGAGQRFFGLPLCCHSALQGRDPTPPWEPFRAWRVWETFHMTPEANRASGLRH